MSQSEVLEILKKHSKPVSRRQIADELKDDPIKISKALARLLIAKEIKCIEMDRYQTAKILGLKKIHRRTRFYYL